MVPGSTRTFLPSTKHSSFGGPPALPLVCVVCTVPVMGVVDLTPVWERPEAKLRPITVNRCIFFDLKKAEAKRY